MDYSLKNREIIKDNIEYSFMVKRFCAESVDEIVDLILETVCSARKTIRIAGDDYPAELVKAKFLELNSGHVEFIFECLKNNTSKIRNITGVGGSLCQVTCQE